MESVGLVNIIEPEEHADAGSLGATDRVTSDSDTHEGVADQTDISDAPDATDPTDTPATTIDHTVAPDITDQESIRDRVTPTFQEQTAPTSLPIDSTIHVLLTRQST